jgi:branched-chain amino acid aminotransferase
LKLWLNDGLADAESGCVSPSDHGLLAGDGVFETLRCYRGMPFALAEHLERLEAGALALGLRSPPLERVARAAHAVIQANALSEARMRITLTSGPGPPGLARGTNPPTLIVGAFAIEPWPPTASAGVSRWRRDERSPLAGIKTVSLVDHVMALAEARRGGADEAILLNGRGELCEATTANVFCVRDGQVATPALSSGCLAGITRERVLRLCSELRIGGLQVALPAEVLHQAEELFLTSSTREIQPLVTVDGRRIGNGTPGAMTKRLARAYSEMVAAELLSAQ